MTHKTTIIATISAILALTITMSFVGNNSASAAPHTGFITSVGPYIKVADPATSSVTPIITDADMVGPYKMSKIPDGIGFVKGEKDQISIFMNHELDGTEGEGFAKI